MYNYLLIVGTQQWFFEDFKGVTKFINSCVDKSEYPLVYKLVNANGELLKDGKK